MRVERIDLVERYILENRTVSLENLCEKFQVSLNTIRRDLEQIQKKGTIEKVYGGVRAMEKVLPVKEAPITEAPIHELPLVSPVLPYELRHNKNEMEKNLISRATAGLVEDGDTIYIDTGTTCRNMVSYLSDKRVTLLTNSLSVCFKSLPYGNLNVISLPGVLKRETLSLVGADAVSYLSRFNINKCFLACAGMTITNGLTNAAPEECAIKQAVVFNSQTRILMADHTKFGRFSLISGF